MMKAPDLHAYLLAIMPVVSKTNLLRHDRRSKQGTALPLQRALTRDIVLAAHQQQNQELMPLWSGQAAKLCRCVSANALVSELVDEVDRFIDQLRR